MRRYLFAAWYTAMIFLAGFNIAWFISGESFSAAADTAIEYADSPEGIWSIAATGINPDDSPWTIEQPGHGVRGVIFLDDAGVLQVRPGNYDDLDGLDAVLLSMGSRLFDRRFEFGRAVVFRDICTGREFRLTGSEYKTVMVHLGEALLREME